MRDRARNHGVGGFTLVELLVSMVVLTIVLLAASQLITTLRSVITQTTSGIQEFKAARLAFETMTRRLGQATLNAYEDLDRTQNEYVRASELRFISGDAGTLMGTNAVLDPTQPTGSTDAVHPTHAVFFQAPLGFAGSSYANLPKLLNTCGYFIEWNSDRDLRPPFLPAASPPLRWRYRLMELIEPSENLSIYRYTSGSNGATVPRTKSWSYFTREWFQTPLALPAASRPAHVVAENIVFLALLPIVAPRNAAQPEEGDADGASTDIAPKYLYDSSVQTPTLAADSRNQLPPMVRVVMVAVDEPSFLRYQAGRANGGSAPPSADLGLLNILTDAAYAARAADLATVTNALAARKITYRAFSKSILMSAK